MRNQGNQRRVHKTTGHVALNNGQNKKRVQQYPIATVQYYDLGRWSQTFLMHKRQENELMCACMAHEAMCFQYER